MPDPARPLMSVIASDFPSQRQTWQQLSVAVLIPWYNEGLSIEAVIQEFRAVLPTAVIYVYDNNSSDRTAELAGAAGAAGAMVRREPLQGKGNVVRRMFADVEADIYVMVDGDATYHAPSAPAMIERLLDGPYDMVTGTRVTDIEAAYRPGHRFGNVMLTTLVAKIFGRRTTDMLSGYRVFSRRFVKSFPSLARGFEIETELTVHALELRMPITDMPTPYKDRPLGSTSKLRTFHDGFRILWTILTLVKDERPLEFFSLLFALSAGLSVVISIPVFVTYLETGLVPRLPTAVLASGLGIVAFLSLTCGLILETVTRGRREMKRMQYIAIPAPAMGRRDDAA